jgi:hypothetical protein
LRNPAAIDPHPFVHHQYQSEDCPLFFFAPVSTKALTRIESKELAAETPVFAAYLQQFGLPTDNIIATTAERGIIAANLPTLLDALPPSEKQDARYLSKFVGATAVGLFDAALNYVWNEVVLNLRKKAGVYGLDLFFDAAVGGKNRELYKTEADLSDSKTLCFSIHAESLNSFRTSSSESLITS